MKRSLFLATCMLIVATTSQAASIIIDGVTDSQLTLSSGLVSTLPSGNNLVQDGTRPYTQTIALWINLQDIASISGKGSIVAISTSAGYNYNAFGLHIDNSGQVVFGRDSDVNNDGSQVVFADKGDLTSGTTTLSSNNWVHLSYTLESFGDTDSTNDLLLLYMNGELVGQQIGSFGLNGNLARNLILNGAGLNMQIQGLQIYNEAKSQDDIKVILADTKPIPEPTTTTLGFLGLSALLLRRKRR